MKVLHLWINSITYLLPATSLHYDDINGHLVQSTQSLTLTTPSFEIINQDYIILETLVLFILTIILLIVTYYMTSVFYVPVFCHGTI